MQKYTFNWEIQTLLEQFIGAFNDIVIKRYDKDKTLMTNPSSIKVSYVYSPKSRVFQTLNNPAPGGLVLPVVAVNISRISRDNTRVFNKIDGFNVPYNNGTTSLEIGKRILQPVPVNIGVNMTMITKTQSDMDQILSNFIPYNDPYVVISWKIPNLNENFPVEIRSEVLWGGDVTLNYPLDLQGNQSYRITADTGFTIKGWMFKEIGDNYSKIYTIDSEVKSYSGSNNLLQSFDDFSTETLSLSARPQF